MNSDQIALLRKGVEWVEAQDQLPNSAFEREWSQGYFVYPASVRQEHLISKMGLTWVMEQQEQGHTCGTAYCLAGYLGQLIDPRYLENDEVDGVHVATFVDLHLGLDDVHGMYHAVNTAADIRSLAEELAGEKL